MNAKQLVVGIVWLGFAALTIAIFAVEGSTALAIPYPRLASIGVTVEAFGCTSTRGSEENLRSLSFSWLSCLVAWDR